MSGLERKDIYVLPNSHSENDRLDYQHELLTLTFGRCLHRAPIHKPLRVLDIGCGTGNWASDFALQYPEAEVIGIDIEKKSGTKSGFDFRVADMHSPDTWSRLGEFDYIHARFLALGVRDWKFLLQKCFDHLTAGGWLEFQELYFPFKCMDGEYEKVSRVIQWSELMIEAGKKLGIDANFADSQLPQFLQSTGFADIQTEEYKMYTGPWMEDESQHELARMGQKNLCTGFYGFSEILFPKCLGWTKPQYNEFMAETVQEMAETKYRTWLPVKVHLATRPS